MDLGTLGEHGAVVLQPFTGAEGRLFKRGEKLSPDLVLGLPLRNRLALRGSRKIEFMNGAVGDSGSVLRNVDAAVANSAPLPATPEEQLDPKLGENGGVTLAEVNVGGQKYPVGVLLPARLIMGWPVKNRHALQGNKRIAFFEEPLRGAEARAMQKQDRALAEALLS